MGRLAIEGWYTGWPDIYVVTWGAEISRIEERTIRLIEFHLYENRIVRKKFA